MLLKTTNPDPFALGKHHRYTRHFRIAGWSFLLFSALILIDPLLTQTLENETVLKLEEKVEQVRVGGKYGCYIPRSYFELETENLSLRLSPNEAVSLALKPGSLLTYGRTFIFRQRVLMQANGIKATYNTFAEGSYRNLLLLQGAMALLGLIGFIPGQVRQMALVIAGLLSLFTFLAVG